MPVEYKDYYQTLKVPRTATEAEIKKSFRQLAREFHPDVAQDKKRAEEKFKEINEAYEVLSDPDKRRKYDELGANWRSGSAFRPPPGAGGFGGARRGTRGRPGAGGGVEFEFGGTGFSDFFEQMFGSRMRGGFAGAGPGMGGFESVEETSRDIEGDILVTLNEAHHGSLRTVTVRHEDHADSHQVKIPAGITEGQKLRVAGRGEGGGDLYLRVKLARHPDFEVDGHNLLHELAVAPWEAVLGAEIAVPTLDGKVSIKIPPGTTSGQKLRVRGRGLARKGDLFVVISIAVPGQLTEAERALWEQLARESTFKPREA